MRKRERTALVCEICGQAIPKRELTVGWRFKGCCHRCSKAINDNPARGKTTT
jgi:hypothetical protein